MRTAIVILVLTVSAAAQNAVEHNRQMLDRMGPVCRGSIQAFISSAEATPVLRDRQSQPVTSGDPLTSAAYVAANEHVLAAFKAAYPGRRVTIALASNSEVNAWAIATTAANGWVCVPTAMVTFMGNEDEIAFMLAHELGHTVDDACLPVINNPTSTRDAKAICESRADEIGYHLIRAAGYSPFAAAGMFGKIEMYSGDTATGFTGFLRQLSDDHPITPKRIENMRRLLLTETSR